MIIEDLKFKTNMIRSIQYYCYNTSLYHTHNIKMQILDPDPLVLFLSRLYLILSGWVSTKPRYSVKTLIGLFDLVVLPLFVKGKLSNLLNQTFLTNSLDLEKKSNTTDLATSIKQIKSSDLKGGGGFRPFTLEKWFRVRSWRGRPGHVLTFWR